VQLASRYILVRSETAFVVAVKEREQTRPDILSYEKALCMKQIKGE
jgi:hypothetical protein